jgi:solute carrier family 35 protein E1
MAYFGLWYLGNYYYNITNKMALKATGGAAGFPLTISALQLGIGSLYGIFLWLAPDAREKPKVTFDDVSILFDVCVCIVSLFREEWGDCYLFMFHMLSSSWGKA